MEEKWYYSFDGKQYGPTTKTILVGKIKPDTLVYSKKTGKWVQASEVPELGLDAPPMIPNVNLIASKKESSPVVLLIMFVVVPGLILAGLVYLNYLNSDEYKKDKEAHRAIQGLKSLFRD